LSERLKNKIPSRWFHDFLRQTYTTHVVSWKYFLWCLRINYLLPNSTLHLLDSISIIEISLYNTSQSYYLRSKCQPLPPYIPPPPSHATCRTRRRRDDRYYRRTRALTATTSQCQPALPYTHALMPRRLTAAGLFTRYPTPFLWWLHLLSKSLFIVTQNALNSAASIASGRYDYVERCLLMSFNWYFGICCYCYLERFKCRPGTATAMIDIIYRRRFDYLAPGHLMLARWAQRLICRTSTASWKHAYLKCERWYSWA